MFCCRESNGPSNNFATPSVASLMRDSMPDFKTLVISPACFENLWAPPLQSTERIMYQERPTRTFGRLRLLPLFFEIVPPQVLRSRLAGSDLRTWHRSERLRGCSEATVVNRRLHSQHVNGEKWRCLVPTKTDTLPFFRLEISHSLIEARVRQLVC